MNRLNFLLPLNAILTVMALTPVSAFAQTVTQISTTESSPWTAETATVTLSDPSATPTIAVSPKTQFQTIDGFGGCFNELGWVALQSLTKTQQDEALNALFNPKSGCGFSYGRMPIGASDFSRNWYSLDETPGDYELADFSILRDEHCLIPYIKAALAINPRLKIWGSPWSPPSWMKQNNDYHNVGSNVIRFDPKVLSSYARYLARYVIAYQQQGIPVFAVDFQNEPISNQDFPSCQWNGQQEHDFIRDYLGPEFANASVKAQLWLGTINDGNINDYASIVLGDPATARYITGVGYQWEGRNAIGPTHAAYPAVKLMQTETECGGGENNWSSAVHTWGLLQHYLTNYANSYMYWNMVLDQNSVSSWGWKQNAMINIDTVNRTITYNPEYYLMKHFGQFVLPGAIRIGVSGPGDPLAFQNADGSIVIVMANLNPNDLPYTLGIGTTTITGVEPANSFSTVRYVSR